MQHEGDVRLQLHGSGRGDDDLVEFHVGFRIPGCEDGHRADGLPVHGQAQPRVVGKGLFLEQRHPQVRTAGIIGHGLPYGQAAAAQYELGAGDRTPLTVLDGNGHAVVGKEAPVVTQPGEIHFTAFLILPRLGEHQIAPEGPVGQVVPLTGRYQTGQGTAALIAARRAAT